MDTDEHEFFDTNSNALDKFQTANPDKPANTNSNALKALRI